MDWGTVIVLALTSVCAVAVGAFVAFTYITQKVGKQMSDLQLRFMDEAVRAVRETSAQSSAESFRTWSTEKRKFLQDNTPQFNPEDLESYLQKMDSQSNVLVEMWRKVFAFNQTWTKDLMEEEEESQRILENAHRLKEEAGMMNLEAMRALDNATSKAKAAEEFEAKTRGEMEALVAETKAESERILSEAKAEARGLLASATAQSESLLASLNVMIPLAQKVQEPSGSKAGSAGTAESRRVEWERQPTPLSGLHPIPAEARPSSNGLAKVEAPTPGVGSYRTPSARTATSHSTPASPHPAAQVQPDESWALVSSELDAIVNNLDMGVSLSKPPEDSNLPVAQGKPRLQVVR